MYLLILLLVYIYIFIYKQKQKLNLKRYEFVPGTRMCGRTTGGMKLCLLWNWEGSESLVEATGTQKSNEEDDSAPPCDCYYTEVKLLDVVRCRVEVASKDSGDNDSKENGTSSLDEDLPKLVVSNLSTVFPAIYLCFPILWTFVFLWQFSLASDA